VQGCTPGYWKNHTESWVGFSPNQTLEDVFDVPNALGFDNVTLLDALNFGGKGQYGKQQNLLRAAVAALLNSTNPNVAYPLSTQQIIDAVNAALATPSTQDDRELASTLDGYNNLGAPLCGFNVIF
jgi:hypothetical protein